MAWYVHCHIQQRLPRSSWIFFFREAAQCFFFFCPSLRFPPSLSFKHGAAACQRFFFSSFSHPPAVRFLQLAVWWESLKSTSCQFGSMKHQIALKKSEALKPSVQFLGLRAPLNNFIDWNESDCLCSSLCCYFLLLLLSSVIEGCVPRSMVALFNAGGKRCCSCCTKLYCRLGKKDMTFDWVLLVVIAFNIFKGYKNYTGGVINTCHHNSTGTLHL